MLRIRSARYDADSASGDGSWPSKLSMSGYRRREQEHLEGKTRSIGLTRLLMIDVDTERAQQVEKRLRLWGLQCSVAESYLYALTTLEWQRPELILIRSEIIDGMTPREFCSTVKQDPSLREIPLILIVGATDSPTEFRRFDLILEESDNRTLGTELVRFLRQRDPASEVAADTKPRPSAVDSAPLELDREGFSTLMEELTQNLQSGRLTIRSTSHQRPIFVVLDHGQIVHAVFGGLEGPPAFRRLLVELDCGAPFPSQFDLEPRWKVGTYPRSIQQADRRRLLAQATGAEAFDTQVVKFRLPQR